jgi:hypothetical protein
MTTITIEVTEDQARQLTEEADRMHLPVQDLAVQRIFTPWQPEANANADVSFDEAMEYVFQKNSELYRRLA